MGELVERLRAKYTVMDEFSTIRRPVNPDGHEAADRIEQLEKALRQIVLMPECMDPAADMCEIAMKALGWEEIGGD